MTLQSQSIRSSSVPRSSEPLVRMRRRGQRRLFGMVLLILILGGGFIWLVRFRDGGGPQSARAADTATTKTGSTLAPAADPIATNPITPKVQAPAPTVLDMASKPRPGKPGTSNTLIPSGALPSETMAGNSGGARPVQTPPPAITPTMPIVAAPPATTTGAQVREPLLPLPGSAAAAGGPATSGPATRTPAAPAPGMTPGSTMPSASETAALPADLAAMMAAADRAASERKPVEARTQLNHVLLDPRTSAKDREGVRNYMAELNKDLVFSPTVFASDPLSDSYKVVSGDNLVKIARKQGSVTEPSLIARINKMSNPNALRIDQSLKVLKGPFHAVVSKSAYRMDIYAGAAPSPTSLGAAGLPEGAEPGWTYICSFTVGLGEKGATPLANFVLRENKLVNPTWANPRTGEKFGADDPKNPIGERWIGLQGLDEKSKGYSGYGIHGTIQPESIGREMSMGCVRMRSEDVEVVYELLMPKVSVVKIVP